ncbi:membrane insertase OXA1 [Aspergillus novofumigatus IBT 16806]|uniref:Putative mitochondrial export translocase Oxa1 n=1 Tax=Aspergillus novofumigatus (strain IBT 16806) TaxID=1392255 RepID=A0A2I1CGB5_ASPN1|nr:putative mitochondrial export translocase Oxa1 [Aspergillus novofumigatus IBT 16806]PKX96654.1 putative mitochondrial export translocase Oxa1 [Aspergillus novofumigatus IBT 16806]
MLAGAGLKGRGGIPTIARQHLTVFPRSSRSISSFRPQSSGFPVRYGGPTQTLSGKISWKPAASIPGVMSARFNSTSSATDATASEHLSDAPTDMGVPDLSDLSAADLSSIPENIGYLKDLGLDYGWGPSSIIQFFIEHIHMWGGLPWWASIVGTGLLLRLALLYPTLGAVDTSTKMLNIKPVTEPLRQQMIMRGKDGNQIEMLKLRAEIQKIHQEQGIVAWKSFIPMLQIPFGFGCYRVVKGMAALPVPGLAMESVAWLKDLTVADPYFILPAASSLFMYLSIRKGGENGVNQLQGTTLGRLLMFGLPALSFLFMGFFPSALQLYFVTTGLFGLGQAYLLGSDTFRKSMNIALPVRQPKNGQSPGHDDSQQSRSIRTLREHLEAERAKMIQEEHKSPDSVEISFIDRALNNLKEAKENIKRETTEKLDAVRGQAPVKNADGTVAEPPRLGEKDLKLAADYERRRKEEEDWKREERNHARREAHLKALELEREKARSAFKVKQR